MHNIKIKEHNCTDYLHKPLFILSTLAYKTEHVRVHLFNTALQNGQYSTIKQYSSNCVIIDFLLRCSLSINFRIKSVAD